MSMTNEVAANRITRALLTSEADIDAALSNSANLLAEIARARMETAAPFATGQAAIMRLVKTLSALSEARADMARVHGDLRKVGEERCDIVFPDECPPKSNLQAPQRMVA